MHLVIGFIRVMFARFLASLYRLLRADMIGRSAVRLCCSAFTASAGIDDAAIEVIQKMGEDGVRLLDAEAMRSGKNTIAQSILETLRGAAKK